MKSMRGFAWVRALVILGFALVIGVVYILYLSRTQTTLSSQDTYVPEVEDFPVQPAQQVPQPPATQLTEESNSITQNTASFEAKNYTDTGLQIAFTMPVTWKHQIQSESGNRKIVSQDYSQPHVELLEGAYISYSLYPLPEQFRTFGEYLSVLSANYGGPWKEAALKERSVFSWVDPDGFSRVDVYWQAASGRVVSVSFRDKIGTSVPILTTFLTSLHEF